MSFLLEEVRERAVESGKKWEVGVESKPFFEFISCSHPIHTPSRQPSGTRDTTYSVLNHTA